MIRKLLFATALTACIPVDESVDEIVEEAPPIATVEQAATITKRIPVRIVETHDCRVNVDSGCAPYTNAALLTAAFDRFNATFAAAGIEVWVKSVDYVDTPTFEVFQDGDETLYAFSAVESQLRAMFPAMPAGAFSASTQKRKNQWLNSGASLYGDPDEALFVLHADGRSQGQFPESGRFFRASIGSFDGDHDADSATPNGAGHGGIGPHEFGHFLGLRHANAGHGGVNPETGDAWTAADAYDMYRCSISSYGLTSKTAAQSCNAGLVVIENDNAGAIDEYTPTLTVFGNTYDATDNHFPGLLFDLGAPLDPPDSYPFGVNVMTYYSNYGMAGGGRIDLRMPARISASQASFVQKYLQFDEPYKSEARADHVEGLAKTTGLVTNSHLGLRPVLGTQTDDMLWLNNGNMTFANRTTPISGTDFEPIGADLDGNGLTDLVWYRPSTGVANVWLTAGPGLFSKINNISLASGAVLVAGDFDNNGKDELVVHRPGLPSTFRAWNGSGFTTTGGFDSSGWTPIVGNFDGANGDDILWYSPSGGNVAVWWSTTGTSFTVGFLNPIAAGYRPFAGDFDGDNRDDVFFYIPGSAAADRVWYGQASKVFDSRAVSVSGTYNPIVGDFDGNGRDDVLWEHAGSIVDRIWRGNTRTTPFLDEDRIGLWGTFLGIPGRFDANAATDIFWYER